MNLVALVSVLCVSSICLAFPAQITPTPVRPDWNLQISSGYARTPSKVSSVTLNSFYNFPDQGTITGVGFVITSSGTTSSINYTAYVGADGTVFILIMVNINATCKINSSLYDLVQSITVTGRFVTNSSRNASGFIGEATTLYSPANGNNLSLSGEIGDANGFRIGGC
mmetsp:Transcript_33066/g.53626  ORF Transcript_33066/g.53626 Transcript_33066/m.53626 type:complete len:168 (-) Transcript_33066:580-1083(-)